MTSKYVQDLIQKAYDKKADFLDLGNCGLKDIPRELMVLSPFLKRLNLGSYYYANSYIKHTLNNDKPNSLGGVTNFPFLQEFNQLNSIYLNAALIDSIDFNLFRGIRNLEIGDNSLTHGDVFSISRLDNLSALYIANNMLGDAGIEFLSNLNRLKWLHVGGNEITDAGVKYLIHMSNLTYLNICENLISFENVGAEGLKGLLHLDIRNNRVGEIGAKEISMLTNLTRLRADNNKISDEGTESISKLFNLTDLEIGYNQISDKGVKEISKLTNLSSLNINGNLLKTKGVEALSALDKLTSLSISDNDLTYVGAEAIGRLTHLSALYISRIQLADKGVPFITPLKDLNTLFISGNELTDKGVKEISHLNNLSYLYISQNKITSEGAKSISRLKNLYYLNVSYNYIADKGAEAISQLERIEYLNIDNNRLTDKGAKYIARLGNLSELYIDDNQLTDKGIEVIVKSLNLKKITFARNKVNSIPKEISDDIYALKAYFKSVERVNNTLVKMILIGNTTAGKSSLAEFLASGKYNEKTERTHGIKLWKWELGNERNNLQVNIWDFGGQDYYHATHNIFLDNKTLYLLLHTSGSVHEINADKTQFLSPGYWLGNIQSFTDGENVIWYIQSKADLYEPKYLDSSLVDKYSVRRQFFISLQSANKKTDVNPEFSYFYESLCAQLAHLAKGELPISWARIRDEFLPLWREEKLFCSVNEFKSFCLNALRHEPGALHDVEQSWDGLLPYLKGCGEVVYFPETSLLSDMVFLSMEKLTNGIYSLLSETVRDSHGAFTLSMLKAGERNYAELYLKILLAYGLVFEKRDQKGTYIAPQYLPENPYTTHFEQLMKVAYIIHFPEYMSRSLITKFLVTYAGNAADNYYWKYGAFFQLRDIHLFVRIDAEEQKVYVHIGQGKARDRYEALRELFFFFVLSPASNVTISLASDLMHSFDQHKISFPKPDPLNKIDKVPGEIELSLDDIHFVSVEKLREAVDNKAYKVKSRQGGYIVFNAVLHQLLNNNTTMPKKIFLSYAHKDEEYKKELDTHFAALKRSGKIETWHDRRLMAGEDWDVSIKKELYEADIVLLLLSPDFMASDYIWNTEIPGAIEKGVTIVPIFLRPCDFKESVFEIYKTQGLPNDAKWIVSSKYEHRDEAYLEVVNGIKAILDK